MQAAVSKALACLSKMKHSRGGFLSWGEENSESCAQAILALTTLDISLDDSRFVKNGNTLLDNLLTYLLPDGSFAHTPVSYTHLDVYKRQGRKWPPPPP